MSEAKFKHGPWSVVTEGMKSPKVVDAAGHGICHTTYAPTNAEATARLIASAPELMDALKALLNYDNLGAYERADVRQKARAAIAKATGQA